MEKLKRIKLLAMDVDGVLTDGSMIVSAEGDTKVFNVYDGLGIGLAMAAGLEVVWITGNVSPAVARRAESLGITELFQGARYKSVALLQIAETQGLALEEIAYIGDDLNDLPALESAGVGFAVANAVSEVKDAADIVTAQPGGRGAVREAIEMILKAQDRWNEGVKAFLDKLHEEEEKAARSGAVN